MNLCAQFQDILHAYKDLCDHVFSDKALISDHKKAGDKMSNIKRKVRFAFVNFKQSKLVLGIRT